MSNKDFRIDSGYYTKEPLKSPFLKYDKIKNHLRHSQYGISIDMNTDRIGYPIYRMNEIHNMLCDLNVDKYANISQEEYTSFALNNGDVLFNRTNSFEWVGRTGIYYKTNDDNKRVFASYLVRFNPIEETILPEYLCAYLNCKYGVWDVKRRARQSINQTNVNPEEVKEIDIPLLDKDIQRKIKDCFVSANDLRLKAKAAYDDASNYLNLILGLNHLVLTEQSTTQKRFKDIKVSDRFDAEYYQPKYDELKQHLMQYEYKTLSEIAYIYRGNLISENSYCEDATKPAYIRGADISSNILLKDKCVYLDSSFVPNKEIRCKKNDLVFALIGSVGTVARVTDEFIGSYISNNLGIIRLKENVDVSAEYLHLFLTAKNIGSLFFEQKEMRTAQPKISPKDIEGFIIPIISNEQQCHIVDLIQESFILRLKSNELLDLAKTSVEVAIEQGEDKALYMLENYTN